MISDRVGKWCQSPYSNHPKGCPNYNATVKCPHQAPLIGELFDLKKSLCFVHSEFDLAVHVAKMEKKHPEWTLKQCKCVLYWQGTSRKQLKDRIREAMADLGADTVAMVPEALGVNVYATARLAGLNLERIRYLSICRHVALIGNSRHGQIKLF